MKRITYLILSFLFIVSSCQKEDEAMELNLKIKEKNQDHKVAVCHKGRGIIYINIESVPDHLGHGDTLGPCTNDPDENYTLIPDDNFEQALIDYGFDNDLDNLVLTANISSIEVLDIRDREIEDLTGIEDFSSLIDLNCSGNSIATLDLSNNLELEVLNCYSSRIENIDITNNTNLTFINCNNNLLTGLNVANNINLTQVYSNSNRFTSLDFSNNPLLVVVACRRNRNLEALNVQNGSNTSIVAFDARFTPLLSCIQVDDADYSLGNWPRKDAGASYSENCN